MRAFLDNVALFLVSACFTTSGDASTQNCHSRARDGKKGTPLTNGLAALRTSRVQTKQGTKWSELLNRRRRIYPFQPTETFRRHANIFLNKQSNKSL